MIIVQKHSTQTKIAINISKILIVEPGAEENTTNIWVDNIQKPIVVDDNYERLISEIKTIKKKK